jgi:pimeloyl-ACP methyl ester carboxylesterase/DNA-binding CsgD family transcriptional regulator
VPVLGIQDQVIRTTTVGGDRVAYSVVGDGPPVLVGGWWCSHLELNWQDALFREFFSRLAERHSVIRYDRPGTGASGPDGSLPRSVEGEVAVMAGVVEAMDLDHFALIGASTGGATAIAYATTHARQVSRLVLYGSFARGADIASESARTAMLEVIAGHWGLGSRLLADVFLPGASTQERESFARFQRQSATREQAAQALAAAYAVDVTDQLTRVRAPTCVIHRRDDRAVPFALGTEIAHRIKGSAFAALDGVDHFPWRGDAGEVADAMLRGLGHRVPSRPVVPGPKAITEREREILALVAAGLTDAQIAERLTVSPHTVHRHVANARAKLGVRSRAAAAAALSRRRGSG